MLSPARTLPDRLNVSVSNVMSCWGSSHRARRLVAMSVSVVIGVAAGFLALAFGAAAVLAVFWDTPHRIVTAIGIAGAFAAIFLVTLARIVVLMDARRRSFARSRQEWALTWQSLKERL